METVNNLDEAMVLGYFETVRSTLVLKLLLLAAHTHQRGGAKRLDAGSFSPDLVAGIDQLFPDEKTLFGCLKVGAPELLLNLTDDLATNAFSGAWIVFEHVLKDLVKPNYSQSRGSADLDYARSDFEFTSREKKDIELFAYIRHALQHHNGAYYGYRSIDHVYGGTAFRSKGQEGVKIECSPELAYRMVRDLELLTSKAWTNHRARHGTLGPPTT